VTSESENLSAVKRILRGEMHQENCSLLTLSLSVYLILHLWMCLYVFLGSISFCLSLSVCLCVCVCVHLYCVSVCDCSWWSVTWCWWPVNWLCSLPYSPIHPRDISPPRATPRHHLHQSCHQLPVLLSHRGQWCRRMATAAAAGLAE